MVKLRYLGHSSFLASFNSANVLIDPYIHSESKESELKRLVKSPVDESSLPGIGLILLTHEHFDHCDKKAIESISSKNMSTVVAPENILQELNIEKSLGRTVKMGDTLKVRNIDISVVPAHHPLSFYPVGYILRADGKAIYHSGDTELLDDFPEEKVDAFLVPIGGTYTMDLIDAVKATKTIKPAYAIPMHYNTFEAIKADPNEFQQRIEKSILKTKPVILKPGEEFEL